MRISTRKAGESFAAAGFFARGRALARPYAAPVASQATRVVRLVSVLVTALPPLVCASAIILAGWRINNEPFRDQWASIVGGILVCAIGSVAGVWQQRRWMERDLLPRKARLEALLKELDAP